MMSEIMHQNDRLQELVNAKPQRKFIPGIEIWHISIFDWIITNGTHDQSLSQMRS